MEFATVNNSWIDPTKYSEPEILKKARHLIENNLYCTLSTSSANGSPWSSPLLFAYDNNWNIYWCSALVSQHSQNIYHNQGRAAISIFDLSISEAIGKGLYLYGKAHEVDLQLLPLAIELLFNRANKPLKTVQDFLGNSPRRMYQFKAEKAWISGERITVDSHLIDSKILINLNLI